VVAPGFPHHVTQRGNYRQPVFEAEEDYVLYLELLKRYSHKYKLSIWAYCLMGNHVHFVCVPLKDDSLAKTFNTLHMRYAQYLNRKKGMAGHLWQGRFYSCILDERHVYGAVRYVENNSIRSGLVKRAEDYRWSSARSHVTGLPDEVLSKDCPLTGEISNWQDYLKERQDKDVINDIRKSGMMGRPCGDDSFVKKLERKFGRRLKALPRGRPRKKK
jgi:putative transposase